MRMRAAACCLTFGTVAACSGGGSADPAPAASAATPPPAATTPAPAATNEPTATTQPITTTAATTTTSTTTPATTAPGPAALACDVLTSAPYLVRRDAVAALVDRDGTAALCADALVATEQAIAVETARDRIDGDAIGGLFGVTCQFGEVNALITNSLDVPIGFYGLGLVLDADGAELADPDGGRVVWSILPGEQRLLTTPLARGADDRCGIDGSVFLADDPSLPGDAGLPSGDPAVPPDPPEPADWLPLLLERELTAQTAVDPTLVPLFEDVRSLSFERLSDPEGATGDQLIETDLTTTVCGEVDRLDDDHVALVFEQRWTTSVYRVDGVDTDRGPGGGIWLGAFRRGQDGLWRWLGPAREIPVNALATCEGWNARRS